MTDLLDEFFPSRSLKVEDLGGQEREFTVKELKKETLRGGETKPCLYFEETPKRLILNKTKAEILVENLGRDSDTWPGKKVTLQPDRERFDGKLWDIVSVKPESGPEEMEVSDDDIFD